MLMAFLDYYGVQPSPDIRSMKSYDEIRDHLQAELERATYRHAREDSEESGEALKSAQDRYDRFSLHGMIPEDLAD